MRVNRIGNQVSFNSNNKSSNKTNIPKLSGQLSVGLLGVSVLTGILHKPKLHIASSILMGISVLTHILSLNQYSHKNSETGQL